MPTGNSTSNRTSAAYTPPGLWFQSSHTQIIRDLKKAQEVTFSLAFVTTQEQINSLGPAVARKAGGDAIVWFAYPKGSSKKYKSQINRDNGWNVLGQEGFEPVRMVAIDEDWSAKRFRRAGFIKNMTRPKEQRLTVRRARPAKAPPADCNTRDSVERSRSTQWKMVPNGDLRKR